MDSITTSLESLSISNKKVLYYSIAFNNYKEIIEIVKNTLVKEKEFFTIYTKKSDSYELYEITDNEITVLDNKFNAFINKLNEGENFAVCDDKLYTLNSEFHITTLFTGGKFHEKSAELDTYIGKKVSVKINKLGISNDFIVLGIEYIKMDEETECPYYGNPVKHITIALNKTGKKVFPKDSYTALEQSSFDLDIIIYGIFSQKIYE
jgi:hypothetical protein